MIRWLTLLAVPLAILAAPAPAGLTPEAWKMFAVYCAAILGLILRPAAESVVLLAVVALGSFILPIGKMLNGFSSSTVWMVFSAFLISQAFADTGLGRRIAYIMVGRFGKSALGLVYSAAITDALLSPATPSNTARSGGIVYPIFRNVASALGSEPGASGRKIGAYLTLSMYGISMTTSSFFITACAPNALMVSFAKNILKVDISWAAWAIALFLPGVLVLACVPYIIYKLYPPEMRTIDNAKEMSEKGLQELGPLSGKEKLLILFFILAIVGWSTGHLTKIDSTAIALAFFSLCTIFKLISWDSVLANKGAWSTLMWYGGIIGIANALAEAKFFTWLAKLTAEHVSLVGYNTYVVLFILLAISLLVRYVFASMGAYVGAFTPVLFAIGMVAQAPVMPLVLLVSASAAYGCLLTHYGGAVGPVLFGTGYVDQKTWWKVGAVLVGFNVVIYMTLGLGYWKLLGLW